MADTATPPTGSTHALLAGANVPHRIVEHAATYHARDEAEASGLPPGRVAKTVVTVERGIVRLAVVPASRRLDLDRLRAAVGASAHLRLASESEAAAAFPQFEVGAVPPLGRLLGVDQVVDQLVLEHPAEVLASAGDHTHGLLIDPTNLVDAAGARVADICTHWDDDGRHRFRDASLL